MLEYKDATIKIGEQVLATNFSFIAKDGELTCVTGNEGSGKSVLLKTLMGFLPVSEGFVSVDGELLTIHSAHAFRKMMVYLPQQMQLLGHALRAPEPFDSEADEFAVWNALLPSAVNAEDIFALAEKTLKDAADKPVVIADEPTALLTPELTMCMIELLRQQAKAGKTVLIASRKPQVIDYADQVIRLEKR